MKRIQVILMVSLCCFPLSSQVDSTSIAQMDSLGANLQTVYCELVGTSNLLGTKVTVEIDMGQSTGFLKFNAAFIMDKSTGKWRKFNSMIDAMNFMGEYGWEFVQAYAVTYTNNTSVYHYLLKQTVLKGENGYYPATRSLGKKKMEYQNDSF